MEDETYKLKYSDEYLNHLKGYGERNVYSRRIDKKHRLTYEVFEEERYIEILSAYGHYE
ncbi:hypothetical protein [Capnocytophaga sputigena]|uniref:hypothetical protein n=1 Tax=Capnocytophaga sputigena TaxID=1019 RepID=UPI00288B4E92|nr:hypothetical protein [Capnocytophaga sputigena]